MISVLLVSSADRQRRRLPPTWVMRVFTYLGAVTWHNLVREALQRAPDLVVADEAGARR